MNSKEYLRTDNHLDSPVLKFETYGLEVISKEVKKHGDSGRIDVPLDWVGKHVEVIRID
ncbi:DUF2080 family transposase-associated protein [Syntrophus aciditrophicus]|uniref:DUF2080 family transposase-associated protein n=1 Tax=Syntrophus aciditrophicus TaxID=316277 RepID=UPI0002F6DC42|nr:DUF2080 family transposase-associated protein [Syntrophus aciditrophicus]